MEHPILSQRFLPTQIIDEESPGHKLGNISNRSSKEQMFSQQESHKPAESSEVISASLHQRQLFRQSPQQTATHRGAPSDKNRSKQGIISRQYTIEQHLETAQPYHNILVQACPHRVETQLEQRESRQPSVLGQTTKPMTTFRDPNLIGDSILSATSLQPSNAREEQRQRLYNQFMRQSKIYMQGTHRLRQSDAVKLKAASKQTRMTTSRITKGTCGSNGTSEKSPEPSPAAAIDTNKKKIRYTSLLKRRGNENSD